MAEWTTLRVVLRAGPGAAQPVGAGRIVLAADTHTLAEVADLVDSAFGRWDMEPEHIFSVAGRRLSPGAGDDSEGTVLADLDLRPGDVFTSVFDPQAGWEHDWTVGATDVDPVDLLGDEPGEPVIVFGWGRLPDQYGRDREDDEGFPEAPPADGAPEWSEREADEQVWADAEIASYTVVERALAGLVASMPRQQLDEAVDRLVARRDLQAWPDAVLWAAAELDSGPLPADPERLWLRLAAAVFSPGLPTPLDAERESAWLALEAADWAGAVIELARAGEGAPVDPDIVVGLIARCPEIEGDQFTVEDEQVLAAGLDVVVALWRALGVVGPDGTLTALGRWGLPEALRLAWTRVDLGVGRATGPDGVGAPAAREEETT